MNKDREHKLRKNSGGRRKTRNLSIFQYLDILQVEFIVAEFRKKIYHSVKSKSYYQEVMNFKKEKIEDISMKNGLPTIFNDKKVREEKYKSIYGNSFGFPNIPYREDVDPKAEELRSSDRYYYYSQGSEVKVKYIEEVVIGTIEEVDFITEKIKIKLLDKEELISVDFKDVSRII